MLANTLNTNEVKGSTGSEVEFTRLSINGRSTEFAKIGESPASPHRMSIKHTETGSGTSRRKRSVIRFDLTSESDVDQSLQVTDSCYIVLDSPVGARTSTADSATVLANLLSFCATTGAATTVLFDCTGNGAKALLEGSV